VVKQIVLKLAITAARVLPAPVKRGIYRMEPLARLVRGMLNRAAPAAPAEVTIAAGGASGFKMRLDLHLEKDYWLGTYETDLQAAVADLIRPGWTVYDVGANIGYVTLILAKKTAPDGRIFAFEALPANLERLRAHVAMNGLAPRVTVVPKAVTDASGTVRFLVGPSGAMGKAEGSAGREGVHRESIEVPAVSLDDFIYREGNPPPQAVKMDIEGGEVLALRGMTRLLTGHPPLILLELHGPEAARAAWDALTAAGYTLHRMVRGYPRIPSLDALDWKAYVVGMR